MSDEKTKEIHKTEFIDKNLPTILYEKSSQKDMTNVKSVTISISDTSSEKALDTFKKMKSGGLI
jgi:hypothetical protein